MDLPELPSGCRWHSITYHFAQTRWVASLSYPAGGSSYGFVQEPGLTPRLAIAATYQKFLTKTTAKPSFGLSLSDLGL